MCGTEQNGVSGGSYHRVHLDPVAALPNLHTDLAQALAASMKNGTAGGPSIELLMSMIHVAAEAAALMGGPGGFVVQDGSGKATQHSSSGTSDPTAHLIETVEEAYHLPS